MSEHLSKPLALVGRDHPVLHEPAELVTDIDGDLWQLVVRMRQTLIAQHGEALAAPQVGRPLAVVVTAAGDVVINPRITDTSSRTVTGTEGCLSLPGRIFDVERPRRCSLEGHNLAGESIGIGLKGDVARLWMHEVDHLNGVLVSDRWPEIRRTA